MLVLLKVYWSTCEHCLLSAVYSLLLIALHIFSFIISNWWIHFNIRVRNKPKDLILSFTFACFRFYSLITNALSIFLMLFCPCFYRHCHTKSIILASCAHPPIALCDLLHASSNFCMNLKASTPLVIKSASSTNTIAAHCDSSLAFLSTKNTHMNWFSIWQIIK